MASLLVRRAVEEATRLKIPSLFLWTSTAEALYLKLGWRAIERTDYCGQRILSTQMRAPQRWWSGRFAEANLLRRTATAVLESRGRIGLF